MTMASDEPAGVPAATSPDRIRTLMLVNHPATRSPIPKITPLVTGALRAAGHEVTEHCWGRHFDGEGWGRKVFGRWLDIEKIRRRLIELRPDILYVNTATGSYALARDILLLKRTRGLYRKSVLLYHGSEARNLEENRRKALIRAAGLRVSMADAVFLLSREDERAYRRRFPQGRFYVVSNPYRSRAAEPLGDPPAWVRELAHPVLLFVGRLMREKGVMELLDAIGRLCAHHRFTALFVGDGPLRSTVEAAAASGGGPIRVMGYLEGAELDWSYRASDLFVLPSYAEGFPTVITEAMDAGLPVVTSGITGALDHLTAGVNGFFVQPGDAESLTRTLDALLTTGWNEDVVRAANAAKIRSLSPDNVAAEYVRHFREILASGP